jgi:glycosyltransferase involved in cell wall biosynthesis
MVVNPVKILFDAFWWVEGPVSNRQILQRIVENWRAEFPQDRMVLAVRAQDLSQVRSELGPSIELIGMRLRPHGVAVVTELGGLAKRVGADVILAHNFTPVSGRAAVFIQDVLFLTNPDWFTRTERLYFSLMPLSARRAARVLASSAAEAVRIDGNVSLKLPALAVGLAPNPALLSAEQTKPALNLKRNSFILTVGRLNVRKNLERVCQAAILSPSVTPSRPLVVAGGYQGKAVKFSEAVQGAIREGSVVLAGNVTDGELAWLYSNASTFVFASLDEGFGLPPVEALAFGAPVIASDIPVMRENLGENAIFVPPTDVSSIAAAMEEANRDDDWSDQRIAYASERFSWSRVVNNIRRALLEVDATGR